MKRILVGVACAVIVAAMLALAGCGERCIGTWYHVNPDGTELTMTFEKDKTGYDQDGQEFTWRSDNGMLLIEGYKDYGTIAFSETDDTLVWSPSVDENIVYWPLEDQAKDEAAGIEPGTKG